VEIVGVHAFIPLATADCSACGRSYAVIAPGLFQMKRAIPGFRPARQHKGYSAVEDIV
jgi:hypothetical protein